MADLEEVEAQIEEKKKELEVLESGFHPFKRRKKQAEIDTLTEIKDRILKKLAGLKTSE